MADNTQSSTVSDNPRHTIYPDESNGRVLVRLPLTTPTGKVRVKRRDPSSGYVSPVSTRKKGEVGMLPDDYIEWQIGYDLAAKHKELTNLKAPRFEFERSKSGKGKQKEKKFPYELSELLYYARQFGWVGDQDLLKLASDIGKGRLLENRADMCISSCSSGRITVNKISFVKNVVGHPLLVHGLSKSGIFAAIQIREKQRAVGIQPMLYLCIPFGNLDFVPIIPESGRLANTKEKCGWRVGKAEVSLILDLFRILGMLSPRHRDDTCIILRCLFPDLFPDT